MVLKHEIAGCDTSQKLHLVEPCSGIDLHAHPYDVLTISTPKHKCIVAHSDEDVVSFSPIKLVRARQLVVQGIPYHIHPLNRVQIKIVENLHVLHMIRSLKRE